MFEEVSSRPPFLFISLTLNNNVDHYRHLLPTQGPASAETCFRSLPLIVILRFHSRTEEERISVRYLFVRFNALSFLFAKHYLNFNSLCTLYYCHHTVQSIEILMINENYFRKCVLYNYLYHYIQLHVAVLCFCRYMNVTQIKRSGI